MCLNVIDELKCKIHLNSTFSIIGIEVNNDSYIFSSESELLLSRLTQQIQLFLEINVFEQVLS